MWYINGERSGDAVIGQKLRYIDGEESGDAVIGQK